MRLLLRWIGRVALLACLVVAAVVLTWAVLSRHLPELRPWHRDAPRREARASDLDGTVTRVDYPERAPGRRQPLKRMRSAMARMARSSPGETSVSAMPVARARPVRPTRCT